MGEEEKSLLQEAAQIAAAMSVKDTIQNFIAVLSAKAWQHMGLVINPLTGKSDKKLEESRLAIDAVSALVKVLEPILSAGELRQYRALVQDLQLNFVNQSSSAN
ncbi:MAG: DUF1844 domain-containing protein [Bacillota bacterium]